tara:strand:- start:13927 stop:15234 length:1308 start_codon:yes stop_codon:yes gene_type:complete
MIAVQIENLWKEYRLGVIGRGSLAQDFQSLLCRLRGKEDPNSEIDIMGGGTTERVQNKRFFALRGVDLEIEQGDIVGIVGKNGAGKSTLLKILSQITKPTKGVIRASGRTASLLEVGTGFHPELTGRENIYLNGAILGMTRREVRSKFDAIVDFSGVGTFVDTPVKRYSSGMYVRLAFAVAAHLDPEILIVDEVLAVGDAEFQERCLGKMKEVSEEGRTVIFVSHQMNAIESLCTKGVIMEEGRVSYQTDDIRSLIRRYLVGDVEELDGVTLWTNDKGVCQSPYFTPNSFGLYLANGEQAPFVVRNDEDLEVRIEFEVKMEDPALCIGFAVYDEDGRKVFLTCETDAQDGKPERVRAGRHVSRTIIPRHYLNEGLYTVKMAASLVNRMWLINLYEEDVDFRFRIQGGLSHSAYWTKKRDGVTAPVWDWQLEKLGE